MDEGFIYFVQADCETAAIKIGFARSVERRIALLQTGCPYALKILANVPGTLANEKVLHRRFADDQIRGEWFRPSEALLNAIKSAQMLGNLSDIIGADAPPSAFGAIFQKWPSMREFANDLGVPSGHARQMRFRDSIDSAYWMRLVEAAKRRCIDGVTLTRLAELSEARRFACAEAANG